MRVLLLAFLLSTPVVLGQTAGNYAVTNNTTSSLGLDANANVIDMTSGTTVLVASGLDDTASALTNFNLGSGSTFSFKFCGTYYTSFGVSDNGIVTLGVTPGTTVYALPNTTVPTISPFANDTRVGTDGEVEAKIVGTAPNRTLVIQWTNNMIRYLTTAAAGTATYQVRLYESSNVIEFVYGTMTTNAATVSNYYVGISTNTTANNLITINSSTNATNTTATATINTYTASATITSLNSSGEGSRKMYRFTPPLCSTPSPPTNLNLTAVTGGGSITGTFTAPGTTPTGYLVIRTTTSTAPSTPVTGVVYTPGSTALGGYIVSTNTTTGISDNGLTPSTSYWYWVYSYNNTATCQGPVYSTSLSGTKTTLACTTATNTWAITGAGITGNWSTPGNWSLGHAPYPCENAVITWTSLPNSNQTTTITIDVPVLVNSLAISTTSTRANRTYTLNVQQTANNPITITNNLTVSGTGGSATSETYFGSDGTVSVGGIASFGASGTNIASTGAYAGTPNYYFRGNVTFGASGTVYSGGTYYFDAAGAQTVSMATPSFSYPAFQNIVIGDSNTPTVTVSGGSTYGLLVAGGNLTVNSGSTLDITSTNGVNQDTASTGIFTLGANSVLKLGGASKPTNAANGLTTSNFPGGFATVSLSPTSTVEYYGATQSIYNVPTYGNLTVSTSGTKTALGNLTVAGNVLVNSPATFAGSTFTHNVAGNWTNGGTYTPSTGTVAFTKSSGTQTVNNGASSFYNLTHSGAGILQLVTNNLTISNNLILNGGVVDARTNTKTVVVSNNASGAITYTAGFIDGNLQRAVNTTATSYLWPVGFGSNYTPASYTFTILTNGNLNVVATSGDEPNLATSSLDSAKSVNAYWTLSGTLASTNYSGTLTYPSALNDDTSVVSTYKIGINNSGWTYPAVSGTPTTTSLSFTNSSGLGTMAIAKCKTPDASNAGTNQSICITTPTVTLAANNPTVGSGTWSVVSGPSLLNSQFSNINAYNSTFTPAAGVGTYTLRWTVDLTTPASCSNPQTSTVQIIVNPNLPASVSIGATATTICSGTSVTFTATPTNGGTTPSYQWYVGATPVGTNSATYTTSTLTNGNVVSVVMTSNATPCLTGSPATSNTITMTVNPNLPASVSIGATATTICAGTSVTFTATPTNGGTTPSYQWYVGATPVGTNSATYTTSTLTNGNVVSVVMTSNATPCLTGSPATSNTITMTVNPNLPASVSIGATATTICSGTSVTFTATPTNGGTTPSYQWYVGATPVGTNSATYTTTTLANGNAVSVVMTSNASPCLTGSPATSNTVTMTVNPNLPASVSISATATTICAGTSVTFTATPTNGGTTPSYQWYVGATPVGTNSATYTTTTLANGNAVSVVMTSNASPCLTGSPATSNTVTMTVNPNLPASVSISATATTICAGTSVTFTATPTNGGTTPSYQWYVGATPVGTNSATYTTTTLANGNSVSVVMTSNATPCLTGSPATSNTITMTVNPNLPASVSIAASATTICAGTSVTFTATPTNEGTTPSYQWYVGAIPVGTNSATYTTTTLANGNVVSLVMTSNASPCLTGSPATSNTITMTVNPLPTASIVGNNGPVVCSGSTITFTITGTSGAVVTYNLNAGSSTTATLTGGSATITVPSATVTQTLNLISVSDGCSAAIGTSSTVTIESTTWDGTAWSNGAPTSTKAAIFTGNYTVTGADLNACSVTVSNNAVVSVASGYNLNINGAVTVSSGSLTLNNNANLYQADANAVNTGNIVVKRNTNPLMRLDYTMWSSPVAGQGLLAFSPLTTITPTIRFYTYNISTNLYNSVASPSTTNFATGTGYLIRVPYNHPTAPAVWTGSFTGVPNNGTQTVGLSYIDATHSYNAVGNPYPSPISISQFATDNASNIEPTLYFWRKTNNANNPSYCTWNTTSNTFVSDGEAYAASPNGVIQTGQGFIVQAKSGASSLVFNNTQRVVNNANQFFRTSAMAATTTNEAHRVWLNLTGTGAEFSQTAVGYFSNATLGADDYDSKFFNDGTIVLNTKLGTEAYAVQGRPVPFDATDVVPLNYKVTNAGTYSIGIDHVDGLFTGGAQTVYIKDNTDGSYHDITSTPYSFTSAAGTFDTRFELVYQNGLLQNNQNTFNANSIDVIHQSNNEVVVRTGTATMATVQIFDIRGRLLVEQKGINASETRLNVGTTNQVLLVQVTTVDGVRAVRKVVN